MIEEILQKGDCEGFNCEECEFWYTKNPDGIACAEYVMKLTPELDNEPVLYPRLMEAIKRVLPNEELFGEYSYRETEINGVKFYTIAKEYKVVAIANAKLILLVEDLGQEIIDKIKELVDNTVEVLEMFSIEQ